jgi:hypothetical protein
MGCIGYNVHGYILEAHMNERTQLDYVMHKFD